MWFFFYLLVYCSTETLILRRNNQVHTELCDIMEVAIDNMILSNKKYM
ncbi:hypothetical protein VT91_14470 [Clostridium sporogenes]|nr:hypothetical protein VT28_25310 [Clostridium sporogenes]KRU29131.1 hypothetical protein WG71_16200 [Clostridium sporogenes]KRU31410.1 hypothetical protein VT91_14470 [Clostridium sporogenes]KRU43828.1 hypothetical protein VT95_15710 [Clostridium sporogenes]OQP97978.1 hypothetical protein VT92_0204820 [Clostridium sporogenes]